MSVFDIVDTDDIKLQHIKREAALYAASSNASKDFVDTLKDLIDLFNSYTKDGYRLINAMEAYNYIKENVNLTPLTLKLGEFSPYPVGEYKVNIRNRDIVMKDNIYYRLNPFILEIKKSYNHDINKERKVLDEDTISFDGIYLTKGGVVTGEYIKDFILKDEDVKSQCYIVPEKIYIKASIIYSNDNNPMIVIDAREPKLKELKQLYDVPIYMSYKIRDKHIDIRKYKKIK